MSLDKLMMDGQRQMKICNACRYCEGYCAVWKAIEWRREFSQNDMAYLANLCHDCRDCYFACPFTTPHEFGINPPEMFSGLREELYTKYAWPKSVARLVSNRSTGFWTFAVISFVLILAGVLTVNGTTGLLNRHLGRNAFYQVLSELSLEVVFGALALWFIGGWIVGAVQFWRDIRSVQSERVIGPDVWKAFSYALQLRYLGQEDGDGRLAGHRKWLHHFVFYGFLLDLTSTALAAIYSHLLRIQAPYPVLSPVVILGILGGIGIMIGTAGLIYVNSKAISPIADTRTKRSGNAFSISLFMVGLTGMLVLVFRETAAMGVMLVIHLSFVASLFFTAPYTKFVHFVYRLMALVRYAQEERVRGA